MAFVRAVFAATEAIKAKPTEFFRAQMQTYFDRSIVEEVRRDLPHVR